MMLEAVAPACALCALMSLICATKPSAYYDMYVAEFEYDGIEYQIVAEQMEAEEVVKVVSSIIYGEEVFVDK